MDVFQIHSSRVLGRLEYAGKLYGRFGNRAGLLHGYDAALKLLFRLGQLVAKPLVFPAF